MRDYCDFSARHYGREALTLENVKMPTPSRPSTGLLFGSVLIESVSVTLDGVEPHLIGSETLPIPLNVDVMHDLAG